MARQSRAGAGVLMGNVTLGTGESARGGIIRRRESEISQTSLSLGGLNRGRGGNDAELVLKTGELFTASSCGDIKNLALNTCPVIDSTFNF